MKCVYGCGLNAVFTFKNGKACCSTSKNKCPAQTKKIGAAIRLAGQRVCDDGKTVTEKRLAKVMETRKTKIDQATGLALDVARALKAHETKRTTMVDGKTIAERTAMKISKTKKGSETSRLAGHKSDVTKKTKIDQSTGLTVHELAIQKTIQTMSMMKDGLTGYERAQRKGAFRAFKIKWYKNTSIFYQGSYEYKFLQEQEAIFGDVLSKHVQRGFGFKYLDPISNQERICFPDFIVDGRVVEIKSTWTWNKKIPGGPVEQRNRAKLQAIKEQGFTVHLILDGELIVW